MEDELLKLADTVQVVHYKTRRRVLDWDGLKRKLPFDGTLKELVLYKSRRENTTAGRLAEAVKHKTAMFLYEMDPSSTAFPYDILVFINPGEGGNWSPAKAGDVVLPTDFVSVLLVPEHESLPTLGGGRKVRRRSRTSSRSSKRSKRSKTPKRKQKRKSHSRAK